MVTCNHIHLLVVDGGHRETIPKSMHLIAGRTGQEYNQRKSRKGAFWEDRYHATAIQSNEHLIRCIAYIDLNMVRAGVVKHPKEWIHSGYNEIQIKERLGTRAKGRKIQEGKGEYQLRDVQRVYGAWRGSDTENTFYWNIAN